MRKWTDRQWGGFAAIFTIIALAGLWLWALTPKAHGVDFGPVQTTTPLLFPINSVDTLGRPFLPDSFHIHTWHQSQAGGTPSYSARGAHGASRPAWIGANAYASAGSNDSDYVFFDDVADIDNNEGIGLYTGVVYTWSQGEKFPTAFSFRLMDSSLDNVHNRIAIELPNSGGLKEAFDNDDTYTTGGFEAQIDRWGDSLGDALNRTMTALPNAVPASSGGLTTAGAAYDGLTVISGAAAADVYALDGDAGSLDSLRAIIDSLTRFANSGWEHRVALASDSGNASGTTSDVNVVQISGDATAADNLETMLDGTGGQKLTLRGLNIVAGGGDSSAVVLAGNGTGHGLSSTGGATGSGALFAGGATSGSAMRIESDGSSAASALRLRYKGAGAGIDIANNTAGSGVGIQVVGGDEGMTIQSGADKNAVTIAAGTGSTSALVLSGGSTGGNGLTITGAGSSSAVSITGGVTGPGVTITGGATRGRGMSIIGTGDSSALVLVSGGAGSGLDAQYGSVGGGYDINADQQMTSGDLAATLDSIPKTTDTAAVNVVQIEGNTSVYNVIDSLIRNVDGDSLSLFRDSVLAMLDAIRDSMDEASAAGTGLDSATTSRIIRRGVWGMALGAAGSTDSTTKAQRVIGGSIAGDSINDHAPHDDNWGATGSALGTGALSDTIYAIDTSGTDTAIPGVYVEARNASGTLLGEGVTDGDGNVVLALPQSTAVTFSAFQIGYTWGGRTITTSSGTTDADSIFGYDHVVGSPSAANLKRVYVDLDVLDGDTLSCRGATIEVSLVTPDSSFVPFDTSSGAALGDPNGKVFTVTGARCRVIMDLIPNDYIRPFGSQWRFVCKNRGKVLWQKTVALEGTSTEDLLDL